MGKQFEATEMWFYRGMLRIPNEELGTTKELLLTIKKRQMTFLGYIVKTEDLENLGLTGNTEEKKSREKKRTIGLTTLSK